MLNGSQYQALFDLHSGPKKTQAAQTALKASEPRPAAPEESAFEAENLLATLSHTEEYAALRQA